MEMPIADGRFSTLCEQIRVAMKRQRPVGVMLLALFFAAGALICLVVTIALSFPGAIIDQIWRLKPQAQFQFRSLGSWSIILMIVVGVACGCAFVGLARGAWWGRRLAIGILGVNIVGDTVNAILRHEWVTLIGLPIGGLMIFYLLKQPREADGVASLRRRTTQL
jgi:hypothetical protein